MKIASNTHRGGMEICHLWVLLGMAEIVFLRDLYNKECQTSSCMYQTSVTLDINPDGKGLCDFHRHSDRLSFLAWLEGSKSPFLQMLAGSRVFPGEPYQNNQAWAAALATELSFHFPFISVVQICFFEDLALWAGAVVWMEMVQTLRSLSVTSSLKHWVKIPEESSGVT